MIPGQPREGAVERFESDKREEEREQSVGAEVLEDGKGRAVDVVRLVVRVAGDQERAGDGERALVEQPKDAEVGRSAKAMRSCMRAETHSSIEM